MYKLKQRKNSHWGISGYNVPTEYYDGAKLIKQRDANEAKKSRKRIVSASLPKRDHFIDYVVKSSRDNPGTGTYEVSSSFTRLTKKESPTSRPRSKKYSKGSYLDQIFSQAGRENSPPGVGHYNLILTDAQLKDKLKGYQNKMLQREAVKPHFLNEFEYAADKVPGPGYYNPRLPLRKSHNTNMKQKDWIEKHKKETSRSIEKASKLPNIFSYNPIPADTYIFEKSLRLIKDIKETTPNKSKNTSWCRDSRFNQLYKGSSKKENDSSPPGPGYYDIIREWPGKKSRSGSSGKKDVYDFITKGIEKSYYHF